MMHGFLLAGAIEAAEADVAKRGEDDFGRAGSVVLGEVVAARASTLGPIGVGGLGGLGALGGVGNVSAAWLSMTSQEIGGTRYKSVFAQPSLDVFVVEGFSLGALVGAGVTSVENAGTTSSYDAWNATFVPRIGSTIGVTDGVALWPRLGAGVTLFDQPEQQKVGTILRVTFQSPFVFRLARHVALEVGPNVAYQNFLAGPGDQRGFSLGVSGGLSIVL